MSLVTALVVHLSQQHSLFYFSCHSFNMVAIQISSLLLGAGALASAAPTALETRASCTFSDAAAAIKGKTSCSAIVIKDMTVPAGTTLDLTKLKDGTTVRLCHLLIVMQLTFKGYFPRNHHVRVHSLERPADLRIWYQHHCEWCYRPCDRRQWR